MIAISRHSRLTWSMRCVEKKTVVPPSAISAEADMHYFSISAAGACWQHILQTKQVGVYVPGDIRDASFEVTVILETNA